MRPNSPSNPNILERRESSTAKYKNKTVSKFRPTRGNQSVNRTVVPQVKTVENVLTNVHASGYYVSALSRLRRSKFGPKNKSVYKCDEFNLPLEPPYAMNKYEAINFNDIRQSRHQYNQSESSSGPVKMSHRGANSELLNSNSSKNILISNANHLEKGTTDTRKLGGKVLKTIRFRNDGP